MKEKKNVSKGFEEEMEEKKEAEPSFSKEQLLLSKRFQKSRDLVHALLEDGHVYTIREVEEKIKQYQKGKVK